MKKVIIVHGYGGNPNKNWFPWLRGKLVDNGVEVIIPDMPDAHAPELSAWLEHLQQVSGQIDENTYFVGHSLGCPTILRFLESLRGGQKVGGIVLVAGFAEPIHFTELNGFTEHPWDNSRIKKTTDKIVLINSDNDPHVPLEMGERLRDRFGAELVVMHNAEHINGKAGFTQVPLVYDKLAAMMGLNSADQSSS